MYAYMYVGLFMYVCMYMNVCVYVCPHVYMCMCVHMYAFEYACMRVCMYVWVYVCMYVHVCMSIYIWLFRFCSSVQKALFYEVTFSSSNSTVSSIVLSLDEADTDLGMTGESSLCDDAMDSSNFTFLVSPFFCARRDRR